VLDIRREYKQRGSMTLVKHYSSQLKGKTPTMSKKWVQSESVISAMLYENWERGFLLLLWTYCEELFINPEGYCRTEVFVKQSHLFHKSRHLMEVCCLQMVLYHFAPVEDLSHPFYTDFFLKRLFITFHPCSCYSFHPPYSYFSTSVIFSSGKARAQFLFC